MPQKDTDSNIEKYLDDAVKSEIEPGEEIIWQARPDTAGMPFQLLKIPLLWLAGLFVYSIGTITDPNFYESDKYFQFVVFVFLLIAIMGIAEIVAIPIQAKKTIYVITNLRTFCIKLRGKFGFSGQADYQGIYRKMLRPEKSTLYFYWAYTMPFQLIFLYLISDVVVKIIQDFNLLCLLGFILLLIGWFYQWYQDYRVPLPRFRDCPKALYYINEWLTSIESVEHKLVDKVAIHGEKKKVADIFLLAEKKGCMRIKSIPDAKAAFDILKEKTRAPAIDSDASETKEIPGDPKIPEDQKFSESQEDKEDKKDPDS